jgi:hypothetical protein
VILMLSEGMTISESQREGVEPMGETAGSERREKRAIVVVTVVLALLRLVARVIQLPISSSWLTRHQKPPGPTLP